MKRLTLVTLIAILVVLAGSAAADEIYVPSQSPPGPHQNNYPFNPKYGDWRYQLVIPTAMLAAQPFTISEIAFNPGSTGGLLCSLFEVRMSHSTSQPSAVFATNLPNPTTLLSSANYTWTTTANTWCPIGLTGLFHYNGTDWLTIEIRYQGGSPTGAFGGTVLGVNSPAGCYRVGKSGAGAYTATSGTLYGQSGLAVRLTVSRATITPSGTGQIGTTLTFNLAAASEAGKPYQVGTSLGAGPTKIGKHSLPLAVDELLKLSTSNLVPALFRTYSGVLDVSGVGAASLAIPNNPALKGVRTYTAFLTIDANKPFGVGQVSPQNVLITFS